MTTSASASASDSGPSPSATDTSSGGEDVVDSGSTSASTTEGDTMADSTSTGTTEELPELDCATIPVMPLSDTQIDGPRGYHGLIITPDGQMIGSDGTSLIASTYDGVTSLFLPGVGYGEQMDWLPDGDFAFATDDGAITRVGLDATTSVIRPAVYAYGVIVGVDDMIYAVPNFKGSAVYRIDPISGDSTTIITGGADLFHSIEFSPDNHRLYIGVIGTSDTVYYVDLDDNLDPISDLEVLSNQVGGGFGDCWHDGIAVDACGNLYVTDYSSSNLYRITPGGDTTVYWIPDSFEGYGHGVVWGTGEHGWNAEAIYMPQPYNDHTVVEIEIGVPSRDFPGTVINAEAPL